MHEQLAEIELIHIIQSVIENNEPLMGYRYWMELILNKTHAWEIDSRVPLQGHFTGLSVLVVIVIERDKDETINASTAVYFHCSITYHAQNVLRVAWYVGQRVEKGEDLSPRLPLQLGHSVAKKKKTPNKTEINLGRVWDSFGKCLHVRIRGAKEGLVRLTTFDTSPSLWHQISHSAQKKYFEISGLTITSVGAA